LDCNFLCEQFAKTKKGWKNGKLYKKVCQKNIKLKRAVFHENTRKYIQNLLEFHFETIKPSIGFIVNQLQNF